MYKNRNENQYESIGVCLIVWLILQGIFPNLKVVKLLLDCDADVNAKNESKSTALHVASNPYNYVGEVRKKTMLPF